MVRCCQPSSPKKRHLEIIPVILSAAKDLCGRLARSFAALRMTGRTSLTFAHGKSSLQMSAQIISWILHLTNLVSKCKMHIDANQPSLSSCRCLVGMLTGSECIWEDTCVQVVEMKER